MTRLWIVAVMVFAVAACGSGERTEIPDRQWDDINVHVQTRPAKVRPGMNEFVIIATYPDRRAAHDMVVSMRVDPDAEWRQAMQDGRIGVYRKALPLREGMQTLYVHLRRDLNETVLEFPVVVN